MDTTQGYILTRIDGLKDMLASQEKLLEALLSGQKDLLAAVEKIHAAPKWYSKLPIGKRGLKNSVTAVTVTTMVFQGADVTSILNAISKMLH